MGKLLKQLEPYFKEGTAQLRQINIKELQTLLHQYGKAAAGKSKNYLQQDRNSAVSVGKRGFANLQDDLSTLASGTNGEAGQALRIARNNYKINSDAIESLNQHALKTLLDKLQSKSLAVGEDNLIDNVYRIAESGDIAALESIVDFIGLQSSGLLKQIQRGIISRAINKGLNSGRKMRDPAQIGGEGSLIEISPDVLKANLPSPAASKVLFKGQEGLAEDIELVFQGLKRFTREKGGSDTAPKISGQLFTSGRGIVDNFLGRIVANDPAMMNILLDRSARKQFLGMVKKSDKRRVEKFFNDLNEASQ